MPSGKNDIVRLRHMLDYARKAVIFTRGRNRAEFEDNEILALAISKEDRLKK